MSVVLVIGLIIAFILAVFPLLDPDSRFISYREFSILPKVRSYRNVRLSMNILGTTKETITDRLGEDGYKEELGNIQKGEIGFGNLVSVLSFKYHSVVGAEAITLRKETWDNGKRVRVAQTFTFRKGNEEIKLDGLSLDEIERLNRDDYRHRTNKVMFYLALSLLVIGIIGIFVR